MAIISLWIRHVHVTLLAVLDAIRSMHMKNFYQHFCGEWNGYCLNAN